MTVLLVESNLKSFKWCASIDPNIALFTRFKNNYCKVYFVVRSSLEKWNFLKISSLDGLLRRTKTVRFSYDKICCVQITNGGACNIQERSFFLRISRESHWVSLTINALTQKNEAFLQLINVLHWQVRENGFSAVHQASSTVTINRVVLLFFCAKRMLRHPQRLGGCESISSQGGR